MVIVKNTRGEKVASSKNIRALLVYGRKSKVAHIRADRDPLNIVGGVLFVEYCDGAVGAVGFASYHIMIDWVRNRRSWKSAEFTTQENIGYLTKPGLIAGGI